MKAIEISGGNAMATRAELHLKYGIVRLMPPHVANEELSPEMEKLYEAHLRIQKESFEKYLTDDDSDDID